MKFQRIDSVTDLEDYLEQDAVIFKHSERCGISKDRREHLDEELSQDITIFEVEVRDQRSLSDQIAERTGVSHESPQVIVIQDGSVVYHASHMDIDATRIAQVVSD